MNAYRPEEARNTETMKAAHRAIEDQGAQKRALKLDCEELRRRLTELQQENSNIDLAIMDLRGQIISSPEKLRGKIDEMQDQLNREKEMFQETEVKERQTQSKINALTQYSQVRQRFTRSSSPRSLIDLVSCTGAQLVYSHPRRLVRGRRQATRRRVAPRRARGPPAKPRSRAV